jgi:hypothetical protein
MRFERRERDRKAGDSSREVCAEAPLSINRGALGILDAARRLTKRPVRIDGWARGPGERDLRRVQPPRAVRKTRTRLAHALRGTYPQEHQLVFRQRRHSRGCHEGDGPPWCLGTRESNCRLDVRCTSFDRSMFGQKSSWQNSQGKCAAKNASEASLTVCSYIIHPRRMTPQMTVCSLAGPTQKSKAFSPHRRLLVFRRRLRPAA